MGWTWLNLPFVRPFLCFMLRAMCNMLLLRMWCAQDVIILPEEAVYKKVDTGREGERVYLMEIADNRRLFYWMQDKDADKDEVCGCFRHRSFQRFSLPVVSVRSLCCMVCVWHQPEPFRPAWRWC